MYRYTIKLILILFLTYIFFLIISVLSFHKIGPMVHLTPKEYSKELKNEIMIRLFYYIFVSLIYNGIVFFWFKKNENRKFNYIYEHYFIFHFVYMGYNKNNFNFITCWVKLINCQHCWQLWRSNYADWAE